MRRGHPGIGGWRGGNPRHFRPRGGQMPHFRPPMPFGPPDPSRFPPPRFRGPRPYNSHAIHADDGTLGQERPYRGPGHPNNPTRPHGGGYHDNRERQVHPHLQMRVQDQHSGSYNKSQVFFEGNSFNTNNMGDVDHRPHDVDHRPHDVDHRQEDVDHRQSNNYGPHPISPWINLPFERRQYNDMAPHKNPKPQGMGESLLSLPDHTGHRPPSSDHYSGTSGPNNNNNPYSRSVDDTVDIVRRRLMNRDSQDNTNQSLDDKEIDTDLRKNTNDTFHDVPHEQPVKKRIQRQRQETSNCDKMKNKIVQQLFKMDKKKIHKLMDNPNSSSKFEYAISSLITESQNSLNKHLRSVAEKSLTTNNTSSDFIHDDNNTIYEDTFMRQMQGILDPQDTLLLEDIKPLVLAELSKVLSGNFDGFELFDDNGKYLRDESAYYNEPHEYANSNYYYPEANHEEVITGDLYESRNYDTSQQEDRKYDYSQDSSHGEPSEPLFGRRPPKQPRKIDQDRSRSRSTDSWQTRRSTDSKSGHSKPNEEVKEKSIEEPRPLFEGGTYDQIDDDDDPFADLDNQYHVAVDHNFIGQDDTDIVSPVRNQYASPSPPTNVKHEVAVSVSVPSAPSEDIIKEIDTQLHSIAKSPIKLLSTVKNCAAKNISNNIKIKKEIQDNVTVIKDTLLKDDSGNVKVKSEPKPRCDDDPERHNHSGKHMSRKRSVDTKPTHRKEKRKKSSHSECHEAATSIFNMFYENKPCTKDSKNDTTKNEAAGKKYSDKYVKRKEPIRSSKDKHDKMPDAPKCDKQKNYNSNSSHSITSPKNSSSSCTGEPTPTKLDKSKLTVVDLFSEGTKPKKAHAHHAHRNTSTPLAVANSSDENKIKPVIPVVTSFARQLTKRHMGTQVVRKLRHKECQTAVHKKSNSGTQTDPVRFEQNQRLSADPLERMKEIDMEIQMLLQEKFKLYNSMESKNNSTMSSENTMGTLGMAVLNVPVETEENKDENDDFLADAIAEDFTNLPMEELEQIAMETIDRNSSSPAGQKTNRRRKAAHVKHARKNTASPSMRNKKAKIDTPNISLLEQIISNDKPIEEIISLDDLERTPKRSKKKSSSKSSKKKSLKTSSKNVILDLNSFNLRECSVVLEKLDLKEYKKRRAECLKIKINLKALPPQENHETETDVAEGTLSPITETVLQECPQTSPELDRLETEIPILESEEPNDIQIDMMEVCEDIVIDDEKTVTDENERVPVSEDIILDNSQSSAEYSAPETTEGECKMYDYSTDDMLKRDAVTVSGNADAVLAIECIDNSFIAACLDGNVYHFTADGQLVSTLRGSNLAVTCLTIVREKTGTTVYTGSLDSRIRFYNLETGLEKGPECNVLSPIQTMDRAWDTVFVGTRTGFVLQFECKNNMLIPVSTVKFSEQSILALRAMKEGPRKVLLVAARSDNVTVKDAQTGLLLRTLEGPKMTVYSLLLEDGKVYCGTSSHQIHVFDYASGSHVHAHEGGKGAVCLRATGGLVFAGCYDGCVYVYREGETRPLAQLRGPALMLLSLAIQGTKIIAGYKDRSLYIWKIPLAVLQEMIL